MSWSGAAAIAVIPCFGLARRKLLYVQTLAGDGVWAGSRLSGFSGCTDRSGRSGSDPLRTLAAHANMSPMRLATVTANRHIFGGQVNGRPLRLLLTFDGGQTLRLGVAGDGFRMMVDSLPLDEPFHMDEYGNVTVEDVTESLFARLQNEEVHEMHGLELDSEKVGVRLMLGGGHAFHFWVGGDELYWGDEDALAVHDWFDGLAPTVGEPVQV